MGHDPAEPAIPNLSSTDGVNAAVLPSATATSTNETAPQRHILPKNSRPSPNDKSTLKYRSDIDGLRAIGVLSVILFHLGVPYFTGGFVGVDIFFVISGYLITKILADEIDEGHFLLLGFYERRIRRIIPALFVMIYIVSIFAYVTLIPSNFIYANIAPLLQHSHSRISFFIGTAATLTLEWN